MALDLSGVRRVVEGLLDDQLQLWRDANGESGDELDEETGQLRLTGQVPVSVPLWEGPGAIVRPGQLTATPSLDGVIASLPTPTAYQALLPLSAPQLMVDDVLSVSRSVRDEQLVGRRFRVAEVAVGTYAVVRVVRLEATG
ncbi:DUF6093 family protein [Streptomyces sp. NPDC054770]